MSERLLERDVATACKARWDKLGLLWRRVEWIGRRGAPDFVVLIPVNHPLPGQWPGNTTVWVETKPTGGKPEDHQQREHERMRAAGQVVLVVDSIEALDRWFPL